jgi:hypothetical protein
VGKVRLHRPRRGELCRRIRPYLWRPDVVLRQHRGDALGRIRGLPDQQAPYPLRRGQEPHEEVASWFATTSNRRRTTSSTAGPSTAGSNSGSEAGGRAHGTHRNTESLHQTPSCFPCVPWQLAE